MTRRSVTIIPMICVAFMTAVLVGIGTYQITRSHYDLTIVGGPLTTSIAADSDGVLRAGDGGCICGDATSEGPKTATVVIPTPQGNDNGLLSNTSGMLLCRPDEDAIERALQRVIDRNEARVTPIFSADGVRIQ